jgi:deoxyribonuclease-1
MFLLLMVFASVFSSHADQNKLKTYGAAKKVFWKKLYSGNDNRSLYCNESFEHSNGMNIEHVFAASWMKLTAGCKNGNRGDCRRKSPRFNKMEADLHNLYPTRTGVNSARGSMVFAEIEERTYSNACPIEIGQGEVEPADFSKGKVARAVLYMQQEYGVNLRQIGGSNRFEEMLLKWHCKFPPTASEVERNDKIFSIQNTNNPFVLGEFDCSSIN